MESVSHSVFARVNLSDGVSDSNPAPYHSPMEYRLRIFGFFGVAMWSEHTTNVMHCESVNERAPAVLRRERRWVRSPLAENSTPFWSHHSIPRSDETWLPEWSGKLGGVERCAVRSRGVSWGKPVFRPSD